MPFKPLTIYTTERTTEAGTKVFAVIQGVLPIMADTPDREAALTVAQDNFNSAQGFATLGYWNGDTGIMTLIDSNR